jgi:hypothetical protein
MSPLTVELTVTRNATEVDAPIAIVPPVVPLAPIPSRTRTVRDADRYSPWSSPTASVLVPTFAPDSTRMDPGTNDNPAGNTSLSTVFVAPSLPVLVAEIVYSMTSPGSTAPFGCVLRFVTVFTAPPKSGL